MATADLETACHVSGTRRLRVYRYKRGDGGERFDEFDVPIGEHTTLLDALDWIQSHVDPTLVTRHSCLHASCGTCGVRVDGREELACLYKLPEHREQITVEPLANLPVLSDLAVDMRPFYAHFPQSHPIIRTSELVPGAEAPDEVGIFMRLEDCIECGLCVSACPVASTSQDYVGPAALAAAQRLLEEPRGADPDDVLRWADSSECAWHCHVGMECSAVCPVDAIPAERIMALRRRLTFGRPAGKEHSND